MTRTRAPVVAALVTLIDAHGWRSRVELAVTQLRARSVEALAGIRTLDDYLAFLDDLDRRRTSTRSAPTPRSAGTAT